MTSARLIVPVLLLSSLHAADWIWTGGEAAPRNRFTYFRKVVDLDVAPKDATLLFAADSNAHLWINGQILRRKVTRYHEDRIRAEVVDAGPCLKPGRNVIVVLHHNWGPIVTFQRSANRHAGLYVESAWVKTDSSWRWIQAPEFVPHDKQVVGVIGDRRIRYPQIADGRLAFRADIHNAAFDDRGWAAAVRVTDGPWPAAPERVETPGQEEYPVRPPAIVAAGALSGPGISGDPLSIAAEVRTSQYQPAAADTRNAANLVHGKPVVITGRAGEARYLTVDFERPVHGYPFLEIESTAPGVVIDFGYGELSYSQYSGQRLVKTNGWLNPEAVVGPGYADRYITRAGLQRFELPDERTARWLALHVHFPSHGSVTIRDLGMVKSQYPIRMLGSFDCGDERVSQAVKLGLIHAEVTMTDVYMDTPGREDGQWIEDARLRAILASRWFGDTALRQLLLRLHAESQGKDGDFHPFPPSNYPAYPAAYDWSVQWAAMLYDDYQWTGSTRLVERYWPNLKRYWENVLARAGEDGLFRTRRVLADIRVGVHPDSDRQSSGIVTPFMIARLRWSAEMAQAIGQGQQAREWTAAADRMTEAFHRYHMIAAKEGVPAHVGDRLDTSNPALERGFSQAGQVMAVWSGLITGDAARALLDYTFPDPDGTPPKGVTRWNNPTFFYRSLSALAETGRGRRAMAHFIERYEPYLPGNPRNRVEPALQGPYGGPLPEYWVSREDLGLKEGEIDTAQPRDETGSHGWGAVPLVWLHDTLLGVRIAEPGGGRIRVAPDDAGLPYVMGHTVTPKGMVWVNWNPRRLRLEVRIPDGLAADILLPPACTSKRVRIAAQAGKLETLSGGGFRARTAGEYVFEAY